jgi:hypothetical protein
VSVVIATGTDVDGAAGNAGDEEDGGGEADDGLHGLFLRKMGFGFTGLMQPNVACRA